MDRLTEMEAFATVVDQGGFTDAAKKMGISKSAVSKHVSSLEARLGARLLNRTTRRVSPTEIGLAYYDRARRVLNDAGEADALVSSMQSAPSGLLRISVATDFERVLNRNRSRVACQGMGKASPRPGDGDAGDAHLFLIGGEITSRKNRQDTAFPADFDTALPAIVMAILVHTRRQGLAVELEIISVIGVFDEYLVFP